MPVGPRNRKRDWESKRVVRRLFVHTETRIHGEREEIGEKQDGIERKWSSLGVGDYGSMGAWGAENE